MVEINGLIVPRMAWILVALRKKYKVGVTFASPVQVRAMGIHKLMSHFVAKTAALSVSKLTPTPAKMPKLSTIKDPKILAALEGMIYILETEWQYPITALADLVYIPRPSFKRLLQQEAVNFVEHLTKSLDPLDELLRQSSGLPLSTAGRR